MLTQCEQLTALHTLRCCCMVKYLAVGPGSAALHVDACQKLVVVLQV
jgi:hypothetical protein